MVAHSGSLVSAAEDAIAAASAGNRASFDCALNRLYKTYEKASLVSCVNDLSILTYPQINRSMDTMWGRSKPA